MPALALALLPYHPSPTSISSPTQHLHLHPNDLLLPLTRPQSGWVFAKSLSSSATGWVPHSHLGKPRKGIYRATASLGSPAPDTTPYNHEGQQQKIVEKIAKGEIIEVTNVSEETWRYKKLDGSGVRGAVNPGFLEMVDLDQSPPPRYAPPAAVGLGRRWSVFGSVKRKKVRCTIEAVERSPIEEEEKEKGGRGAAYYKDAVAVRNWNAQVDDGSDGEGEDAGAGAGDGDSGTLGGETVAGGSEMARSQADPGAALIRKEEAEGAVWLGSV